MITKEQVIQAQKEWGEWIVKIGSLRNIRNECEKATKIFIEKLYNYDYGKVLFKPTRASDKQFRFTKEGAIAYFVGENENFPEDTGFAINPWVNVRFENEEIILEDEQAIAMGNVYLTDTFQETIKVEFTLGLKLFDGKLKIFLQHFSIPYKRK